MPPLQLDLPDPLAASIRRCARRHGSAPEAYTVRLLEQIFALAAGDPLGDVEPTGPSGPRSSSVPDDPSTPSDR